MDQPVALPDFTHLPHSQQFGLLARHPAQTGRLGAGQVAVETIGDMQAGPVQHAEGATEAVAVDRGLRAEPEVDIDHETRGAEHRHGRMAEAGVKRILAGQFARGGDC